MKEFVRAAMAGYKRLIKANLIVIDEIILFPVEEAQSLAYSTLLINYIKIHPLLLQPIKCLQIGLKCLMMKY
jgi:hypothetical protein